MGASYNNGIMIAGLGGSQGLGISTFITSKQVIATDSNFAATTRNITITSVTTANVVMFVQTTVQGGNGENRDSCYFEITTSTNLRLTKNSSSAGASEFLVTIFEINPSAFTSNQFINASVTSSAANYKDITISSIDTSKSFGIPHLYSSTRTSATSMGAAAIELTSSTNARYWGTDNGGTSNYVLYGQVITLI